MSQKGSATNIRLGRFFEHGRRLSFAKQLASANIVECSVGEQLQYHIAVQDSISRAVCNISAAFANLCKDSVMIQRLSNHAIDQPATPSFS